MQTIRVTVKDMQPVDYSAQVPGVILRAGENKLTIQEWLDLRDQEPLKSHLKGGFVSVDYVEESAAIDAFTQEMFAAFELLGMPEVQSRLQAGKYGNGALEAIVVKWLLTKDHERDEERDAREAESLSISRRALATSEAANLLAAEASRKANRITVISMICSAIVAIAVAWFTVMFSTHQ